MPVFLSTGALAALMALVSSCGHVQICGTRVWVPEAHCSDSGGVGQRDIQRQHRPGMTGAMIAQAGGRVR